MTLSQLWWISILLFLSTTTRSHGQFAKDLVVYPLRTYACEDTDNLMDGKFDMGVDEDGEKYVNIDLTLDEDITEVWKASIRMDIWNNGEWQENFFNDEGNICSLANKYVLKIWQNVKAQSSPPITDDCTIKAGTYSVKNFKVSRDDYTLQASMMGTLKTFITFFDEYNTVVWCQVMEVEVNKQ